MNINGNNFELKKSKTGKDTLMDVLINSLPPVTIVVQEPPEIEIQTSKDVVEENECFYEDR